jgi:hypothetical protein
VPCWQTLTVSKLIEVPALCSPAACSLSLTHQIFRSLVTVSVVLGSGDHREPAVLIREFNECGQCFLVKKHPA